MQVYLFGARIDRAKLGDFILSCQAIKNSDPSFFFFAIKIFIVIHIFSAICGNITTSILSFPRMMLRAASRIVLEIWYG